MAVFLKIQVFWSVTPYLLVTVFRLPWCKSPEYLNHFLIHYESNLNNECTRMCACMHMHVHGKPFEETQSGSTLHSGLTFFVIVMF